MIITVIGKRGKGKTTLVKQLIQESSAQKVYILDYLGEYGNLESEKVYIGRGGLYEFCEKVWNESDPSYESLAVFDEVDLYSRDDPHLGFMYRYSRHKAVSLVAVSRRFYDLPTIVRALTDEFIFFQITEERDLQYLRRLVSQEYLNTLMNLPTFSYIRLEL